MSQLALIFDRDSDGRRRMRMAVGEPGLPHAREIARQAHPIEEGAMSLIAGLVAGVAAGAGSTELAADLERWLEE